MPHVGVRFATQNQWRARSARRQKGVVLSLQCECGPSGRLRKPAPCLTAGTPPHSDIPIVLSHPRFRPAVISPAPETEGVLRPSEHVQLGGPGFAQPSTDRSFSMWVHRVILRVQQNVGASERCNQTRIQSESFRQRWPG